MAATAILDFFCNLKSLIVAIEGQEVQTVLPCQILWRSLKKLVKYGDFSIFQDGGRRYTGF